MSEELIEKASGELIDAFDRIIPTFYDAEDRERGFISSVDRQGTARTFPFVGVSIGITCTGVGRFAHFGEITERASEMEKYAKQFQGSCFKLDRRQKTA